VTAFTLRPAQIGDAPKLAGIHAAALPPGWAADDFLPYLRGGGRICFLAESENSDAGLAVVQTAGEEAEILTLGVRPSHARQGAGRKLVGASLAWALNRGIRTVYLEVAEGNTPARSLYASLGFTLLARREQYYRLNRQNPEAALILRLDLPAEPQRSRIEAGAEAIHDEN
jgi:ribosomal-protein-alanine N-acetyltransferase